MSDKEKIENQNTESIASQTNEEMNETISSVETIEHPETEITTSDIITSDISHSLSLAYRHIVTLPHLQKKSPSFGRGQIGKESDGLWSCVIGFPG